MTGHQWKAGSAEMKEIRAKQVHTFAIASIARRAAKGRSIDCGNGGDMEVYMREVSVRANHL